MIRDSDTDPSGKADRVVVYVSSDEGSSESDPDDDYDDDAVVISEFDPKSKSRRMKVGCDDDECLVLDGDPHKPVLGRFDPCHDVQVVAEKGQVFKTCCNCRTVFRGNLDSEDNYLVGILPKIACRDYPHARHDCVKFPFRTTPHEKHCDLCHCYVCDSLAPCTGWGTGQLDKDHCHATDQDEDWKARRKTSIPCKRIPAELRMQMNGLKV